DGTGRMAQHPSNTDPASPAGTNALALRIAQLGFRPVDRETVVQLHNDPFFAQELIVFIDARDEAHYAEGHIPGALVFDHYHPEKHLADVLLACERAEQIVVYCTGGDCEDSVFAAVTLKDAGVAPGKLMIYAGGIEDWRRNGLPVETGARNSGRIAP
ncbi:MAG TPA: rhodanese-like domain-containing protein, partial [Verrucomicrobiota bacterium]|nr:rhodanese-like domain-containing protein [Verrucomicrobiota bacterium]